MCGGGRDAPEGDLIKKVMEYEKNREKKERSKEYENYTCVWYGKKKKTHTGIYTERSMKHQGKIRTETIKEKRHQRRETERNKQEKPTKKTKNDQKQQNTHPLL